MVTGLTRKSLRVLRRYGVAFRVRVNVGSTHLPDRIRLKVSARSRIVCAEEVVVSRMQRWLASALLPLFETLFDLT